MPKHYLTREAILAAQDLPVEDVDVPEWGGTVTVRTLTGSERSVYQEAMIRVSADGRERSVVLRDADVRLAALSMIDRESGQHLFSADEVDLLGGKSARALNRVVEVAQRLSGLTARDMEELTQGFAGTPNADSSSGSPAS